MYMLFSCADQYHAHIKDMLLSCMLMQHRHFCINNAQNNSIAHNCVAIHLKTLKLCNIVNVRILHFWHQRSKVTQEVTWLSPINKFNLYHIGLPVPNANGHAVLKPMVLYDRHTLLLFNVECIILKSYVIFMIFTTN